MAGKPRSSKGARGRATGAGRGSTSQKRSAGRPWWKGSVAWVGALVTAVVTGVSVALVTSFSQHAVNAGQQTAPKGPPVVVQHVAAAPYAGDTFAFPQPLNVSRMQLKAFDSIGDQYMPGWVGRNHDYPWAWKHGGAAVDDAVIELDVRGNRKAAVRIEGMQLDEQCHRPITGTLFYSPSAGSGSVTRIGFNLDQMHPIAQLLNGQYLPTFGGPYFLQKTITLNYGEQQQILLFAATKKYYCEFRIDMSVLDGNNIIHEMISNGSQPFRVTAGITVPDPVDPSSRTINFAAYRRLYVGGVAPNPCHGWARANPLIYLQPVTNAVTC